MKKIAPLGILMLFSFPFAALAASTAVTSNNLEGIISIIISLFNAAIPIGVAAALLGFFWGLMTLIWNANNEKKRKEGKHVMIWGIVGLFLILSIVGIISILQNTFSLQNTPVQIPSANPCQYGLNSGGNCAGTVAPASPSAGSGTYSAGTPPLPVQRPSLPGSPGTPTLAP